MFADTKQFWAHLFYPYFVVASEASPYLVHISNNEPICNKLFVASKKILWQQFLISKMRPPAVLSSNILVKRDLASPSDPQHIE